MKSQTSTEYLILVGLSIIVAAVVTLVAFNIIGIRNNVLDLIKTYRIKLLGG